MPDSVSTAYHGAGAMLGTVMDAHGGQPNDDIVERQVRDAVRQAREAQKVTQEQLAERLGVAGVYVSRWESGSRPIHLWRIPQIEEALGLARGTILRNAGLVDAGDSVEDAIDRDLELDADARHLLKVLYSELRSGRGHARGRGRGRRNT
jgi:transcriptional regulator with XRE-family HTH domain